MRRTLRIALRIAAWLLALYVLISGLIYAAMRQPPELFGKVMSRVPRFAMVLIPFRPLWLHARQGQLKVGDPAPDFWLETFDKKSHVRLSSFQGSKPAVLVFGSYT